VAWVAGNVHVQGEPWPYCPRSILRRQVDRAAAQGYVFKTGVEVEFFLVRRGEDGRIEPADRLDVLSKPCYDQTTVARNLDFLTALLKHATALGWEPHATDHEDGISQFE